MSACALWVTISASLRHAIPFVVSDCQHVSRSNVSSPIIVNLPASRHCLRVLSFSPLNLTRRPLYFCRLVSQIDDARAEFESLAAQARWSDARQSIAPIISKYMNRNPFFVRNQQKRKFVVTYQMCFFPCMKKPRKSDSPTALFVSPDCVSPLTIGRSVARVRT